MWVFNSENETCYFQDCTGRRQRLMGTFFQHSEFQNPSQSCPEMEAPAHLPHTPHTLRSPHRTLTLSGQHRHEVALGSSATCPCLSPVTPGSAAGVPHFPGGRVHPEGQASQDYPATGLGCASASLKATSLQVLSPGWGKKICLFGPQGSLWPVF